MKSLCILFLLQYIHTIEQAMAMEAETSILVPLSLNSRASIHQYSWMHTNIAIEIKVVYVRVVTPTPTPMHSTMTMSFSTGEAEDSLTVNGKAAVPVVLKRNRVDTMRGESVYVSTNRIRFSGGCLGFEIRVMDGRSALVVGLVGREGDGMWAMQCKEGGGEERGVDDGALVDVYFVGRSMGRAVVLNRVVELRKRWRGLDHILPACVDEVGANDSKELGNGIMNKQSCGGLKRCGEDEVGELSWFSAGVRVGMGLGLAMCLGIGVGVSLVMRSYQAATGAFRRFI